jgi:hypothetical protein
VARAQARQGGGFAWATRSAAAAALADGEGHSPGMPAATPAPAEEPEA